MAKGNNKATNKVCWPKPSLDTFGQLAQNEPSRLVEWINSEELEPCHLTYALEALGKFYKDAAEILLQHTRHRHRFVREGAVLGLVYHRHVKGVIERLLEMSNNDPSQGVATMAFESIWTRI